MGGTRRRIKEGDSKRSERRWKACEEQNRVAGRSSG